MCNPIDNMLVLEDPNILERDGTLHRMPRRGEAMGKYAAFIDQRRGDSVANHHRGQRNRTHR
jgi:hypothetical protein